MFDKLIDFILEFIYDIIPVFFVKQYNEGILFRCGKFRKVVKPGLNWKIPFFEQYEVHCVVTTTLSIPTQSLTTKDGKSIVVKAVVKYNIFDIKKFMLEVSDGYDAISDTTQGIIKNVITGMDWVECQDNKLDNTIAIKLRVEIKKWGIEVEKVTLSDLGIIRSIRLFNETETVVNN